MESKCKISSKSENSIVTGKTEVENQTSSRGDQLGLSLVRGPNCCKVINCGEHKEVLSVDKSRNTETRPDELGDTRTAKKVKKKSRF